MIGYKDLKKSAKHKMAGNWPQILLTVMLIGIIYVSLSVVSSSSDTLNLGDLLLLLLAALTMLLTPKSIFTGGGSRCPE